MELIKELEEKFQEMKKDLGFNTTLEELDEIFFLKDYFQKERVIYNSLSRAICGRIVDTLNSWLNFIHGLIMPNPNSMINLVESQSFNENERQEFNKLIVKIMNYISRNTMIGVTKDKKEEAKFIDDSLVLWKELKPDFIEILSKVRNSWEEKSKEE